MTALKDLLDRSRKLREAVEQASNEDRRFEDARLNAKQSKCKSCKHASSFDGHCVNSITCRDYDGYWLPKHLEYHARRKLEEHRYNTHETYEKIIEELLNQIESLGCDCEFFPMSGLRRKCERCECLDKANELARKAGG